MHTCTLLSFALFVSVLFLLLTLHYSYCIFTAGLLMVSLLSDIKWNAVTPTTTITTTTMALSLFVACCMLHTLDWINWLTAHLPSHTYMHMYMCVYVQSSKKSFICIRLLAHAITGWQSRSCGMYSTVVRLLLAQVYHKWNVYEAGISDYAIHGITIAGCISVRRLQLLSTFAIVHAHAIAL